MTIFFPDVSQFQRGISLSGAVAVCARSSEGNWLTDIAYGGHVLQARQHNAFQLGYHFLESRSDPASQAKLAHTIVGSGTPLMLDIEPVGSALKLSEGDGEGHDLGHSVSAVATALRAAPVSAYFSAPGIGTATQFIDAYRHLGGVLHLAYLPHWYWLALGSPSLEPLISRGVLLWTSGYAGYSDNDSFTLWQGYGGYTHATVGQYTDTMDFNGSKIDFNAFRGSYAGRQSAADVASCLAQFKSVAMTGTLNPGPGPGPVPVPPGQPQLKGDNVSAIIRSPHCDVVPSSAKHLVLVSDPGAQSLQEVDVRVALHKPGGHQWDISTGKITIDSPLVQVPCDGHDVVSLEITTPGGQAGYGWS
jgi:hypothetical protein